jgi:hypothetical protein
MVEMLLLLARVAATTVVVRVSVGLHSDVVSDQLHVKQQCACRLLRHLSVRERFLN